MSAGWRAPAMKPAEGKINCGSGRPSRHGSDDGGVTEPQQVHQCPANQGQQGSGQQSRQAPGPDRYNNQRQGGDGKGAAIDVGHRPGQRVNRARVPPNRAAKKPAAIAPYKPAAAPRPDATPKANATGSVTTAEVIPPERSPRSVWRSKFNGLGVCAVEMIVARKWGIEARFSRF